MVERLKRLERWIRHAWSTRAIAAGLVLVFLAAAAPLLPAKPVPAETSSPALAPPAPAALINTGPYMRVARPDTNTVELQIAMRQFLPRTNSGTEIWLAAVSHVGESNYFTQLQTFLKNRDLVLFEGVGYEEGRRLKRARKSASGKGAAEEMETGGTSSLQATLAASLGLAFQLDAIDYEQKNFKNSDMSVAQIQEVMIQQIEEGALDDEGGSNPEFLALLAAMEGTSWMGAIMHVGVRLLGSSPKLQAMTRLMLIEVLGGIQGDMSEMKGLPPNLQELMRVLIQARNGVVLDDLKKALAKRRNTPRSVAIFYGAAHMDHLERRLIQDFDYRSGQVRWMSAISVQPYRAGLNDAEIKTIRALVQWQLEALQEQEPEDQGKTRPTLE